MDERSTLNTAIIYWMNPRCTQQRMNGWKIDVEHGDDWLDESTVHTAQNEWVKDRRWTRRWLKEKVLLLDLVYSGKLTVFLPRVYFDVMKNPEAQSTFGIEFLYNFVCTRARPKITTNWLDIKLSLLSKTLGHVFFQCYLSFSFSIWVNDVKSVLLHDSCETAF